ncbi:Beta-1,4-mannooligosaccharide phosphorylase [compost metagenome]
MPNVVFPCATLHDADTGRVAIYYGAADTYVGIAYTTVSDIMKYVIATDEVVGDDRESGRM